MVQVSDIEWVGEKQYMNQFYVRGCTLTCGDFETSELWAAVIFKISSSEETATIARSIELACRVIVLYNGEGLLVPTPLLHSYNSFSFSFVPRRKGTVYCLPPPR